MESSLDIKTQIIPRVLTHTFKAELPMQIVDMMNKYIDEEVIPHDPSFGEVAGNSKVQNSYTSGLVGQIRQDKRSAQLDFDIYNTDTGKIVKELLDKCCVQYLTGIGHGDTHPDVFEAWTVHSYAGDYNPRHSHGVATPAGLSSLMWLKVPDSFKNMKSSEDSSLHRASGIIDGWTQFTWGLNSSQDLFRLKCQSQEAIQPVEGRLLIWPNWLDHEVFPFFGEGERRTFVANFNIFDSIQEKEKYSNVLKEHNKQRKETSSRIKDKIMVAKIDE